MNRRNFLKLTSKATVGTPFMLNGINTQAMNSFLDFSIECSGVSDRVLVIVRLAGANDGLNTIIPISQYDNYANLRPDIKISNTGTNAYIPLDNTLSDDYLSGIHPIMTGFKDLYDNGKMGIMNGVGYPNPNYSHFASENTMFAGKDGNSNNNLKSGLLGRYIATKFPGLAGKPIPTNPDPLAIQLGNSNPVFFYEHNHEIGVEYNISNFQNSLFNQLSRAVDIPIDSEHQELINYIAQAEFAADSYYSRVNEAFAAGNNSTEVYPDNDLGKQLKTVARLIAGGSRTKIFQVNLFGWDTHVDQVASGDSHLGRHADLLGEVSSAISAFQNDVEQLGFADKIMTTTFSEFGRRVRQNGNLGTDHGDISPFFIIGSNINPGVYGKHPEFSSDLTSYLYPAEQRNYDYRQLFATLMQDWLGANDVIMEGTELQDFTTESQKIPIVKDSANAYPDCLLGPVECVKSVLEKIEEIDGWSYYATTGYTGTDYLFAIEHTPTGNGANTNDFTANVDLQNCHFTPHSKENLSTSEGFFSTKNHWNIQITSGSLNGWVNIRWIIDSGYTNTLQSIANEFKNDTNANHISPLLHLRTYAPLVLPDQLKTNGEGIEVRMTPLKLNEDYTGTGFQYDEVTDIHNAGGSIFIKVTNATENNAVDPIDSKGLIRFNKITKKLEGFDGTRWQQFH